MKPELEPVLSTLNADGSRRWLNVRVSPGRFWRARGVVAWGLIALYAILPWVTIRGQPALFCDVINRRLHAFGATFQPTETLPLMLLFLTVFMSIFFITALAGRVWCGWGCPQTVYMEFVFRPLERLLAPKHHHQGAIRVFRMFAVGLAYTVVAALLANIFLSYFFGARTLVEWMQQSPTQHPKPFLVMAATTGLVLFDFGYFREQMCTVICPYARLQSVLLDRDSLIIGYDARRGEPRGKLGQTTGDCIDCKACVVTCPTGIDIRNGLQLECVACAQCIDACDAIMVRIGKPKNLIRYAPQTALETAPKKARLVRPRVVIYAVVLTGLITALSSVLVLRGGLDVWVLRGVGAPYAVVADGKISNHLRLRIQNRIDRPRSVRVALGPGQESLELIAPENPVALPADGQAKSSIFVTAGADSFVGGKRALVLQIRDEEGGATEEVRYTLLGPNGTSGGHR